MKLRCLILSLIFILAQLLPALALQDLVASSDNHTTTHIHQNASGSLPLAIVVEDIDVDNKDLQFGMLPVFVTAYLLSDNRTIELEEQWLYSHHDFFKHRPEPDDKQLTTAQFRI